MPSKKARRVSAGAGACAGPPSSRHAGRREDNDDDAEMLELGEELLRRRTHMLSLADMASPAWLYVLARRTDGPDGDPTWDRRPAGPLIVHSDLLWASFSQALCLYQRPDPSGRGGVRPSAESSEWRLLGLRCAHKTSHLELSDMELMRAVHNSLTADEGELRKILCIDEVVHGGGGPGVGARGLRDGPGPTDEAACERDLGVSCVYNREESRTGAHAAGRSAALTRLLAAVRGSRWVGKSCLVRLKKFQDGSTLPMDALLLRPTDMPMPESDRKQREVCACVRAKLVEEGKAVPLGMPDAQ